MFVMWNASFFIIKCKLNWIVLFATTKKCKLPSIMSIKIFVCHLSSNLSRSKWSEGNMIVDDVWDEIIIFIFLKIYVRKNTFASSLKAVCSFEFCLGMLIRRFMVNYDSWEDFWSRSWEDFWSLLTNSS